MHTIDTIEDLIQLLDEKPEWAEALRVRLLSSELIELPEKFTQFATEMNKFVAEMNKFVVKVNKFVEEMDSFVAEMKSFVAEMNKFVEATNKRLDKLEQRFDKLEQRFDQHVETTNKRFDKLEQRFDKLEQRFDKLEQRFDQHVEATDKRFNRIEASLGEVKGILASNAAIEEATLIAREMGMRRTKTLSREDLWDLIDSADTTGIPTNELRSFRRADLIMEATDQAGETCYLAVEISFTVNGRDTTRAIRNAEFLTRFTDKRAYAAVSGVHRDNRVQDSIESGDVFWYEIDRGVLEPE